MQKKWRGVSMMRIGKWLVCAVLALALVFAFGFHGNSAVAAGGVVSAPEASAETDPYQRLLDGSKPQADQTASDVYRNKASAKMDELSTSGKIATYSTHITKSVTKSTTTYSKNVYIDAGVVFTVDPDELASNASKNIKYIIGPKNDEYILKVLMDSECVVLAWGNNVVEKSILRQSNRVDGMMKLLKNVARNRIYCLRRTSKGCPSHPLYIKSDTKPEIWEKEKGKTG
jgi:hypothetical protein